MGFPEFFQTRMGIKFYESTMPRIAEALEKITDQKKFTDQDKQKHLDWMINYLVEEDFSEQHLAALDHIVGLFNECEESEKEVFDFAYNLHKKYAE